MYEKIKCLCIYECVCLFVYVCVCFYAYLYVCVYVFLYASMCACVRACVLACVRMYVSVYLQRRGSNRHDVDIYANVSANIDVHISWYIVLVSGDIVGFCKPWQMIPLGVYMLYVHLSFYLRA